MPFDAAGSGAAQKMECPKVIIDCDAGTDDGLAIAMLVAAHKCKKIEILGITCVTGNTYIDNVINNVFRTLKVCDALDIPVYKGLDSPLLFTENYHKARDENFHGSDGFGNVFTDKPDISRLKKEHAVYALQKIAAEHYGKVTIVCLAPLTNIAIAMKMYPDFVNSVDKFMVMGGNYTGVGNVTAQAEFNFYFDPESVHIVMCKATKKLWILPWEPCKRSNIEYKWRNEVFGKINTPVVKLINAIEDSIYTKERILGCPFYAPCDAFLAGILLKPEVAKTVVMHHVDIELTGGKTRGQVVIDHLKENEPNAYVVEELNTDIFKELLLFTAEPNAKTGQVLS